MRQQDEIKQANAETDPAYDGIGQNGFLRLLPSWLIPYIRLLRIDRPIGFWLLLWPALWGLSFASLSLKAPYLNLSLLAIFVAGAFLTRSAGCVFNDIVDRDLDKKVARTKSRPIASGAIPRLTASFILALLLLLALSLLLMLNNITIGFGVFIVVPILIYPFMKRITFWPQAMLALCFSWGALMGWTAVTADLNWVALLITLAAFFWTMGFDTIYAHQDREDDTMIGIKSTARKFGTSTPYWLVAFYGLTIVSLYFVGWIIDAKLIYFTSLAMAALQAAWQINTLDINDPDNCLARFRSNNLFGFIIFAGINLDMAMQYLTSGVI